MRLVSALAFTFLVVGCADKGDEGFFILNNTAPPVSGGACTFTGDSGQPFIAAGSISQLATQGYVFTPLLKSRITAVTGMESERTIHLEGANVTLQVANGGMMQSFTSLFSGSLAPNGGTTNVSFELLPVSSIKALGNTSQNVEVVASVTPYGTLGGGRIDGEPFQYPITILAPGNGIVTGIQPPVSCKGFNSTITANGCNPYQDGTFACCIASPASTTAPPGSTVCPGVGEM
ncbi:MAG: hypothetical protein ABJE66_30855 [Deltaproteobacteria bacterium]